MFKIEWLAKGAVVHQEEAVHDAVETVLQTAIAQVPRMKQWFIDSPPDSLRIIDSKGLLVTSVILVKSGDGNRRLR